MASELSHEGKHITEAELAKHNARQSLWIAVHGHVYDLTGFLEDHPGGIDALENSAGTDGTEAYEYAGHGKSAMQQLQKYHVGKLAGDSTATKPATPIGTTTVEGQVRSSGVDGLRHIQSEHRGKLVVALGVTSLSVLVACLKTGSLGRVWQTLSIVKTALGEQPVQSFWAGAAAASSLASVGYYYVYRLFKRTLDYEGDPFKFPPTIPRLGR